jgi:Xaa-Pro aminopeptidase
MGRMNQTCFTKDEKNELERKVQAQFNSKKIDSIITVGSSNITYLSGGMVFPYIDQALVHPVALYICFKTNRRILACTFDLSDIPAQLGWEGETLIYELTEATPEKSLAVALSRLISDEDLSGNMIGADYEAMTGGQLDAFKEALPGRMWTSVDAILRDLRLIKTSAEVRLLEIAGRMGDRGFISAVNHAEGTVLDTLSYPMWEYAERFRVHVGEFGGSGVGNLSVLRGERGRDLYSATGTRETFNADEFIRMEYSVHNYGYWTTGARTVYVGYPESPAEKAWSDNLILRKAAIHSLKAGKMASDVYTAVTAASEKTGIGFWHATDVGHGLGASEREAPFLAPYDHTELAPGMVIVVAVYTYAIDQALIGNKDVYLVTEEEPKLLTWYKNWDDLYALHGTSARHG